VRHIIVVTSIALVTMGYRPAAIFGNDVSQQELGNETIIRAASRMEQVNASGRAYHLQMKRELPVTYCTKCGGAGYNMRVANGRCCKNSGEQRCDGINAIIKTLDWGECTHCQATGYYRNKECPNCRGSGYLFVGLGDKATA
jgi:DnaJ-class molecular chaperone